MAKSRQVARFEQRLAAIPQAVRAAVQPALDQSADELVTTMRRLAPVDEGDLQESIHKEPGDNPLSRKVLTEDYKARWNEFGTTNMAPSPFFWPSFRLKKKRLANRIKRAVSKAVKKEWQR